MIATSVDLRGELHAVRQQGRRQACLAFATSTAHEHHRKHVEPLSVEYLFFHAVAVTPGADPDVGTSMEAAATALAHEGQPAETAWPYQPKQLYPPSWVPPTITCDVHKAAMTVGALSFDELCALLDAGRAVVLGLIITDAFWRPDAGGSLQTLGPDTERGGHAVLAVGWGNDPGGSRHLLIRNSWGPKWGLDGHAWLSEAYVAGQLHETAILT